MLVDQWSLHQSCWLLWQQTLNPTSYMMNDGWMMDGCMMDDESSFMLDHISGEASMNSTWTALVLIVNDIEIIIFIY